MLTEFNGKLELEWIHVDEALPLDHHKEKNQLIIDVFVLIVDEKDPNEDVCLVHVEYQHENKWTFLSGDPYPECHAKNIRYWCNPPNYTNRSVINYDR